MLELEIAPSFCFERLFGPKAAQEMPKRPQEAPRGRREAAKRRQDSAERRQMSTKRCQDAGKSDFGAIWARFGTPRGGKNLDFRCNCRQNSRFSCFSRRLQKRSPKGSKRRPPGGENARQERPGSAQEAPRAVKRRQESSGTDFGMNLERFWLPGTLKKRRKATN